MVEEQRFATAELGGLAFALSVEVVSEVRELVRITRVPLAPTWVVGLCNLRGQVLPVIDLGDVLGVPHETPGTLMVTDLEGWRVGLAVDAIGDVVRAERVIEEVPRTLAATLRQFVHALIGVSDRVLPVLDPVMLSEQVQALA